MGKKPTEEKIKLIKFLLGKGKSQDQIAGEKEIPETTVKDLVIKINNDNKNIYIYIFII